MGLLSWRAKRIADPVERLQFLRARAPAFVWAPERKRRWVSVAVMTGALVAAFAFRYEKPTATVQAAPAISQPQAFPRFHPSPNVWLVEKSDGQETWSNGLRIDNRFLVATHPRSWTAFRADDGPSEERSAPVGIVFHATESQQAPFEPTENSNLQRLGESVLGYVRRTGAYNFVIDRFGRVYRVVAEDETANHAGFSVWADETWRYINLNESFIAISLESGSDAALSAAQVRSGAMLVEMLRHRYNIPAENCVTHAQISVNPRNMRIGYHLDWATGFPFTAMGLPNNYDEALPAIWAFGFDPGADVERAMPSGVAAARERLQPGTQASLRRRYRELLAAVT